VVQYILSQGFREKDLPKVYYLIDTQLKLEWEIENGEKDYDVKEKSKLPESWDYRNNEKLHETIDRALQEIKSPNQTFAGLFQPLPSLGIAAGYNCSFGCTHCIGNCKPSGKSMDYEAFTGLPEEFLTPFGTIMFGMLGDPLAYHSNGKDITDLVQFLHNHQKKDITFSVPTYTEATPQIKRLQRYVQQVGFRFDSAQISYHLFTPENKSPEQVATEMNAALHLFVNLFKRISIPIYASDLDKKDANRIARGFVENFPVMFKGFF